MRKFKIIKIFGINRYYDDDYYDSGMRQIVQQTGIWEECDDATFAEIVEGVQYLNDKNKSKSFSYAVVEMPEEQSELISLSKDEFLKHMKKLKNLEQQRRVYEQKKLADKEAQKEKRELAKFMKLKAKFETETKDKQ